eukprot:748496-Hanusia_phi.AAC.1
MGAVYLAQRQPVVPRVLVADRRGRLLPDRLQLLAPVAPGSVEVDKEDILAVMVILEVGVVEDKRRGWPLVHLVQAVPVILLLAVVEPPDRPPALVQPDLAHPRCQTRVVGAHEIGGIHARVLALEVRKGDVEVDLPPSGQHAARDVDDEGEEDEDEDDNDNEEEEEEEGKEMTRMQRRGDGRALSTRKSSSLTWRVSSDALLK